MTAVLEGEFGASSVFGPGRCPVVSTGRLSVVFCSTPRELCQSGGLVIRVQLLPRFVVFRAALYLSPRLRSVLDL